MSAGSKHTCSFCRQAAATHVLVYDVTSRSTGDDRVIRFACKSCGSRNLRDARNHADLFASTTLYKITEVEDSE